MSDPAGAADRLEVASHQLNADDASGLEFDIFRRFPLTSGSSRLHHRHVERPQPIGQERR